VAIPARRDGTVSADVIELRSCVSLRRTAFIAAARATMKAEAVLGTETLTSGYAATVKKSAATERKINRNPTGIHNSPNSESMHHPNECEERTSI
jgi:hypothetical protein